MTAWVQVRHVLACAAVLVLAACSSVFQGRTQSHPQEPSSAVGTPTMTASSAPTSTVPAVPPQGFPDLSHFTAVDSDSYVQYSMFGEHRIPRWMFAVSKDVQCSMLTAKGMLYRMACEGVLPGVPGGENRVAVSTDDNPAKFSKEDSSNVPKRNPSIYPTLSAEHKIVGPPAVMPGSSQAQAVCAVDGAGTTACLIIGKSWSHGFVLSSQGSWTF